ncbi:hypothetical protein [Nocardia stercoris]|uniref:hypothetical protein n=1 Tax=Nocardia stercoris TaxID=2483361 RepID=UPI0018F29E55|nr:hypothetical protein [Nocardia stercoris]
MGWANVAMGAAPVAAGALVGIVAGNLRGPNLREMISKDLDLLDRMPADQVERRTRLQAVVDRNIDGLIEAHERTFRLEQAARASRGFGRDLTIFVAALLFAFVWWHVGHDKQHWPSTFVVLIAVAAVSGLRAVRTGYLAIRAYLTGGRRTRSANSLPH